MISALKEFVSHQEQNERKQEKLNRARQINHKITSLIVH